MQTYRVFPLLIMNRQITITNSSGSYCRSSIQLPPPSRECLILEKSGVRKNAFQEACYLRAAGPHSAREGVPVMNLRTFQIIIGLVCAFVFLTLALYRVPLAVVEAVLASTNPFWVVVAILVYIVDVSIRTWRWQIMLRPIAPTPYPTVARALLIGYGLNTIIPARLGELFRAEFLEKIARLSCIWALTSIVIERLFDGVTVVVCLGIGLLLGSATSEDARMLIQVLVVGGILFGLGIFTAFFLAGPVASRVFTSFPRLSAQVETAQRGFEILRTRRTLEIAAATFIIYIPDALSLWCIVKAVGLGLSFANTLVLVGAVSLSTFVPAGPAFLGPLQFAYALAIEFGGGTRGTRHCCGYTCSALPIPTDRDRCDRGAPPRVWECAQFDTQQAWCRC
jgi:uncharacterized protein (TIRG00374 family)